MFPPAAGAGVFNVPGSANYLAAGGRIGTWGLATSAFSGSFRTLFRSYHPNQNSIFGAAPNGTAVVAAIQVYSTDLLGFEGSGYRYGDLRITPGFVQLTAAALGPGGNNAISPGPPTIWPLRFLVAGRSHTIGTDGSWTFNNTQTVLDSSGNLGLGVVAPSARLQLGTGGALQFDRPDGTNQFRNSYIANDLLLTWSFNAGATIMSLSNAGALIANAMITGALTASSLTVGGTPITGSGNNSAMQRIAQVVCAGSQATVDFSSIPAGFTNLMVVWQARSTSAAVGDNKMKLQINGDTTVAHYQAGQFGSHASTTNTAGTTAATAAGADIGDVPGTNSIAVASGTGSLLIPGYSGTTFVKQVMSDCVEFYINNTTGLPRVVRAFQWSVTSAINELTFSLAAGNFLDGSTFTVYGMP